MGGVVEFLQDLVRIPSVCTHKFLILLHRLFIYIYLHELSFTYHYIMYKY